MLYNILCGEKVSALGFGAMRLPTLEDKSVDVALTDEMVEYAISHGVNYFDTAYPYHNGMSETVLGDILAKYPRESFYLANKFPGHQILSSYDPSLIFEEQLKKCKIDHFDFYLLHNVYENSIDTYLSDRWRIVEYFALQKRLGRIKHLGFSTHGSLEIIKTFMERYGEHMEFCQIQLNYLDWELQNARAKYEYLSEMGIPVVVMEPVRGGKLANLPDDAKQKLKAHRPDETSAAWCFRYLQALDNVKVTLSGMSNMAQLVENIKVYEEHKPVNNEECELLYSIATGMRNDIPCTACGYCVKGCPMELAIPSFMGIYNELKFAPTFSASMRFENLPEDKAPSACISCGACTHICPQQIEIPSVLSELDSILKKLPKWADICREREEAARRNANQT